MNRYFADVSNYQKEPDFHQYRHKGGHRLIGLKATEGTTYVDPPHARRVVAAHDHGVHVIHYHFARPAFPVLESARAQAEHFWATVKPHHGRKDYFCLDIETTGGMSRDSVCSWVRAFDQHFTSLSGHWVVGYSGQSFLQEHGPGMQIGSKRWWIAAYGPHMPHVSWIKKAWAWQFTDGGIGPLPHATAGVGQSDTSILNRASAIWLRRP